MNYVTLKFLLFVIFILNIYYIFPKKYRWTVLLFGNIIFFISFSGKLIIYAILATLVTFILTKLMIKYEKHKKKLLLINILLVLLILIVLKYNNFISSILNPILGLFNLDIPYKKFLMPIGISYYTLEMISYTVDVYYKKLEPESNFFKLLTFFTFFPKLIEGPISKYRDYKEKMFSEHNFDYEKFKSAWVLIGYGFIKKLVIADRLGIYVDNIFSANITGFPLIIGIIFYTFQIYCDFSGCIEIVSGVSELFGIELPVNFKRPFFSKSVQEFWRRWHITLGDWLKEYIFYPISLSKINMKLNLIVRKIKWKHLAKFIVVAFPLFFVWFTNGLWHGASIKYILYGLYYYIIMMLGVLLKPLFDKIADLLKINTKVWSYELFKIIRTFIIVCIGMLLFRSNDLQQFWTLFKGIFELNFVSLFSFGLTRKDIFLALMYLLVVFAIELTYELKIDVREKLNEQNLIFRWIIYLLIIISVIIFGIYGRGYAVKDFIYGGF